MNAWARSFSARSSSPRRSERTATYRPIAAASTASATDRLATAAIRVRSVTADRARSRLPQHVAHAADRVDQLARARALELAPQVPHIHAHRVRGRPEVIAPHTVVDEAVREHVPGIQHQQLEQLVLGSRQLDEVLADLRPVTRSVEPELGERQLIGVALRA